MDKTGQTFTQMFFFTQTHKNVDVFNDFSATFPEETLCCTKQGQEMARCVLEEKAWLELGRYVVSSESDDAHSPSKNTSPA